MRDSQRRQFDKNTLLIAVKVFVVGSSEIMHRTLRLPVHQPKEKDIIHFPFYLLLSLLRAHEDHVK